MTQLPSTPPPIIIQGAQVLLPSGDIALRDVAIADGKISAVGTGLEVSANTQIIDGGGLTLLPGVIDSQVRFGDLGLASQDDLFSASCACVRGGVTSFLEMPSTLPLTTTQAVLTDNLAIAAANSLVNYGFFIGTTAENLPDLRAADPSCGITVLVGSSARQASETALLAIQRALDLSKKYQRRLHIFHLSTADAAARLRQDKPSWVTVDVTPQHLLLDASTSSTLGTLASVNPSLKSLLVGATLPRADREALWQALQDGVIDFVATGHAPPTLAEKNKGYPDAPVGITGVETALPLMLTQAKENRCTVAQVSYWMSSAVARAYNIHNKGMIEPGFDADLALVDLSTYRPVLREELQTKCGWSPFEGWNLTGWPVVTIVGGQVVYDHGHINADVRGQALQFG